MGAKTFTELPLTARMSDNVFTFGNAINNIFVRFYDVNNINLYFRPAIVMYLYFLLRTFFTGQTLIAAIFVIVEVFILLKNSSLLPEYTPFPYRNTSMMLLS